MRYLSILLLFGLQSSCSTSLPLAKQIAGKWDMVGVRIYDEDASPRLNPLQNRWISFAPEGTFASGSGEQQENAGTYTLTEGQRIHLDSDAGPGDDSDWRFTFRGDTLMMRGIGTPRQEASELVLLPVR